MATHINDSSQKFAGSGIIKGTTTHSNVDYFYGPWKIDKSWDDITDDDINGSSGILGTIFNEAPVPQVGLTICIIDQDEENPVEYWYDGTSFVKKQVEVESDTYGRNLFRESDGSSTRRLVLLGATLGQFEGIPMIHGESGNYGFYIPNAYWSPVINRIYEYSSLSTKHNWVMSVDVYAPSGATITGFGLENYKTLYDYKVKAGEWVRVTVSGYTILYAPAIFYANAEIYWKNWKMELGTKATPWQPALEDYYYVADSKQLFVDPLLMDARRADNIDSMSFAKTITKDYTPEFGNSYKANKRDNVFNTTINVSTGSYYACECWATYIGSDTETGTLRVSLNWIQEDDGYQGTTYANYDYSTNQVDDIRVIGTRTWKHYKYIVPVPVDSNGYSPTQAHPYFQISQITAGGTSSTIGYAVSQINIYNITDEIKRY